MLIIFQVMDEINMLTLLLKGTFLSQNYIKISLFKSIFELYRFVI